MWTLKEKQEYIKGQIEQEQYQDFYAYIQQQVGNFDIESWDAAFLKKIVARYKATRQQDSRRMETSFYQYQQNQSQKQQNSISKAHTKQELTNNYGVSNILPPELVEAVNGPEQQGQNTLKTLDRMFKKNSQKKLKQKQQQHKQAQSQKQAITSEMEQKLAQNTTFKKKLPQNFVNFDNPDANFWGIKTENNFSTQNNPFNKTTAVSPSMKPHTTVDFATIDWGKKPPVASKQVKVVQKVQQADQKWADFSNFDTLSQNSKKPQNFKTVNVANNLTPNYSSQKPISQQASLMSFDQLMSSIAKEKEKSQKTIAVSQKRPTLHEIFEGAKPLKQQNSSINLQVKAVPNTKSVQPAATTSTQPIISKTPSPYQKKPVSVQKSQSQKVSKRANPDDPILIRQDFKDMIKCFPSALREQINVDSLNVRMEDHQIISRTFLMPDYVMYNMRVQPLNIKIQRNYQDFERLRFNLSKHYPGYRLSYLQPKSWFGTTNVQYIKKQKIDLQFFINDLIQNRQLRNSRILQQFLTLPSHKQIKRKFEQYQKLQKPKGLEQLCLLAGRVTVCLSQNQRLYQQHFKKYNQTMINLIQKQEKLSDALSQHYRNVSTILQQLQNISKAVMQQTKLFNSKVYGLQVQDLQQVFVNIKDCYEEQSKHAKNSMEAVMSIQMPFITFQKNNLKQFLSLLQPQQAFMRSYLYKNNQPMPPQSSYSHNQLGPYKTGVLQESSNFTVLKYQAGYLSNQVCLEAKRAYQCLAANYKTKWEEYFENRRVCTNPLTDFYKIKSKNKSACS